MTDRRSTRMYHSIGEVCELLDLKPHVVRYWETQFPQLAPTKNRAGNRVYTASDIETIAAIRRLVHEERFTVEGARRRLEELEAEPEAEPPGSIRPSRALTERQVELLRADIDRLEELLTPPRSRSGPEEA